MSRKLSYEEKHGIFIKSIPAHGLGLNGLDAQGNLIVKQSVDNIFQTLEFQPNTKSFGLPERICFSHLFHQAGLPTFTESYRNAGIIFTYRDGDTQDYFFPCDLLALTTLADIPQDKEKLFADIQKYYQSKIITDRKLFGTQDISGWIERMHSRYVMGGEYMPYDQLIMEIINEFRHATGHQPLSCADHNRLVSHNECIKFSPVKIHVLGVFGNNEVLNTKSKEYDIPLYDSLKSFIRHQKKPAG